MSTFDELPRHRQLNLMWRLASGLPYPDGDIPVSRSSIAGYVQRREAKPCLMPTTLGAKIAPPPAPASAALGDDGRWHLLTREGDRVTCSTRRRARLTATLPHHQYCGALLYADGRYRLGGPIDLDDMPRRVEREARWTVRLEGSTMPAELVPPRERCPESWLWPRYAAGTGRLAVMWRHLVAILGPTCQGCGALPGVVVDHDHLTWEVRGLLCGMCNGHIDLCPHLAGCPFAEYLNRPPVVHLGLRYPASPRSSSTTRSTLFADRLARFLELSGMCRPCFVAGRAVDDDEHIGCLGDGCTCGWCAELDDALTDL